MLEQDPFFTGYATLMDFALHGDDAPPRHEVEAIAGQLGIDMAAPGRQRERRRAAPRRAGPRAGVGARPAAARRADQPPRPRRDRLAGSLARAATTARSSSISHDRTFLTRLTKATLWLDRGNIRRKEIGFGGYEAWEEQVYAEEARAAEKLDAKLKIEAHWLERGVTARRKRNQGRLEKLWEMRAQRAAMLGPQGAAKLGARQRRRCKTKSVIVADNVTKRFGERAIIKDFTLRIQRGDRIGVVGANGSGKTTLLKLLTGELAPDEGTVTLAKTLDGVMIDQQRSLMAPDKTRPRRAGRGRRLDRRARACASTSRAISRTSCSIPDLVDARVGTLSGGERSRLLLAREFARKSNLLVLDEPTNDLDLETLDLLQEVIADYDGTVLIVSHDRDFLDRTVTVTLGLDGSGKVDIVAGGYADWEAKRKSASVQRRRRPAKAAAAATAAPSPAASARASSPTRTSATTSCCPRGSRSSRPRSAATRKRCTIPRSTPAIRPSSPR